MQEPVKANDLIELRKREELHSLLWNKFFGKLNDYTDNNEVLNYKNKLIKESKFLFKKKQSESSFEKKILSYLHNSLYSWLYGYRYNSLIQLLESSNGKGIVICVGDKYFNYAVSTIDSIRNVLNNTLPIEIFFNGIKDLNKENQNKFLEFPNVYLSDIETYFNNNIVNIYGWAIKPFAILASQFDEVLLMDADTLFINKPEDLFNDLGYMKTGTLFFKDRTLGPGPHNCSKWLKSWMKKPLPETKKIRFWNEKSIHEMESSVVVIHKIKTLLGLLNVCKLNEIAIRNIVYKYVWGDKETFWMGFDMARQHYYMDPEPCGFFGEFNKTMLCGHLAHTRNGRLFFWNGNIIKRKNDKTYSKIFWKFNAFAIENTNSKWINLTCLKIDNNTSTISLNEKERYVMNKILERENKYHFILLSK